MLLVARDVVSLAGCPRAVATRLPSRGASQSKESLSSSVTRLPCLVMKRRRDVLTHWPFMSVPETGLLAREHGKNSS